MESISHANFKISNLDMSLEMTNLISLLHLPGTNKLETGHTAHYMYRQTPDISHTLLADKIVDHSNVGAAQLHLHSRLNTRPQ